MRGHLTGTNFQRLGFLAAFLIAAAGTWTPLICPGLRLWHRVGAFLAFLPLVLFLFVFVVASVVFASPCPFD